MYRDILVAVDGSANARLALDHAAGLAEALHARLTILSVTAPVPAFAYGATIDVARLEEAAVQETAKVLRRAVDSLPPGLAATHVLRRGHVAEEILAAIAERGHDLVVVGSRGRGRARSNLLGSVAAELHFGVRIPILIVHAGERPDGATATR